MKNGENRFQPGWRGEESEKNVQEALLIVCRPGGDVLVSPPSSEHPVLPFYTGSLPENSAVLGIGYLDGRPVSLASAPPETSAPAGSEWISFRQLIGTQDASCLSAVSRAAMLACWDWNFRFCGRCGAATVRDKNETARVCPSCSYRAYPRVSPAMIVLIEASETAGFAQPRILLAHNRRFPEGVYSCLAGFVEAGESLEASVIREVREEVNMELETLSYVNSQAWPLPHSLMLGFEASSSGTPVPDGVEIDDARWFTADAMPRIPRRGSISRFLIDSWLEKAASWQTKREGH